MILAQGADQFSAGAWPQIVQRLYQLAPANCPPHGLYCLSVVCLAADHPADLPDRLCRYCGKTELDRRKTDEKSGKNKNPALLHDHTSLKSKYIVHAGYVCLKIFLDNAARAHYNIMAVRVDSRSQQTDISGCSAVSLATVWQF